MYVLLVIAITMREFGRAYAADKLGCVLPRMQGRVTVNPLAHMDMLGTVVFPIACIALSTGTGFPLIFGWGKPVEAGFSNPKTFVRDDVIFTLSGASANLVIAFISALLLTLFRAFGLEDFATVAGFSIMINAILFVINMLPVPPLDGGRLLKHATGMSDSTYMGFARYGIFIFFALVFFPPTKKIIMILFSLVSAVFFGIAELLTGIFVK